MTNRGMPGLVKIGFTMLTPQVRAEQLYTTGVPYPFTVEFSKMIGCPSDREKTIHNILENQGARVNPSREFFKSTTAYVRLLFDLIDGEYYNDDILPNTTTISKPVLTIRRKFVDRKLIDYIPNNTRICHSIISISSQLIGVFDKDKNVIIHDNIQYNTLESFIKVHYDKHNISKKKFMTWKECRCMINEQWVDMDSLSKIPIINSIVLQ